MIADVWRAVRTPFLVIVSFSILIVVYIFFFGKVFKKSYAIFFLFLFFLILFKITYSDSFYFCYCCSAVSRGVRQRPQLSMDSDCADFAAGNCCCFVAYFAGNVADTDDCTTIVVVGCCSRLAVDDVDIDDAVVAAVAPPPPVQALDDASRLRRSFERRRHLRRHYRHRVHLVSYDLLLILINNNKNELLSKITKV